ncbi:MAG: IS1634 family transposase [Trueperaceae bacterium]|nr:MAG: IS1634 family transposase [Trueperaceae bacterium]
MTPIDGSELQSFSLDHLGIVAGIIDEIGLVESVNEEFGIHSQEIVSTGVAVKAMILNGLGFVSAPLYLFEHFYRGKPCEHLLGEGVTPEHLSDDKLGKVLDKLYEADLTRLFVKIALRAAKRYGVEVTSLHLDASSFHVHGRYEGEPREEDEEDEGVIHITHGYSRERRPDLKQFLVDLMASSDEGVPVFFDAASGNESDKDRFADLIKRFSELTDVDALFIADSALYTQENLQALSNLRWVTRVPLTLKEAKRVLDDVSEDAFMS